MSRDAADSRQHQHQHPRPHPHPLQQEIVNQPKEVRCVEGLVAAAIVVERPPLQPKTVMAQQQLLTAVVTDPQPRWVMWVGAVAAVGTGTVAVEHLSRPRVCGVLPPHVCAVCQYNGVDHHNHHQHCVCHRWCSATSGHCI